MNHRIFSTTIKLAAPLLAAAVFWHCAALGPAGGVQQYLPGAYEAIGYGFRGPIHLLVQVDTTGITDIEILEHEDDDQIGGAAMEELLTLVLDANSPDIDGISGATESSAGFLAALEDALNQARQP
jgi:fumarate reductase flavoprotein subunit